MIKHFSVVNAIEKKIGDVLKQSLLLLAVHFIYIFIINFFQFKFSHVPGQC